MVDLYREASAFRKAIKTSIKCGDITETNLRQFPFGCCGYASDLLQRYLFEIGVSTLYYSGQYGYGWTAENHAWLETSNGIVIDITGDQFKDKVPYFACPVYVGPRENGFHDQFVLKKPIYYHEDPCANKKWFETSYNAILRHMF